MPMPSLRSLGLLLLAAGLLVGAGSALAQTDGPLIDVVEVQGPLERALAGHVEQSLARAAADGAEVVVLSVDSPAALGDAGTRLGRRIADSPVPVAVWVGPPGARATAGAEQLTAAAHVLGTSPRSILDGDRQPAFEVASLPSVLVELDGRTVTIDGAQRVLDVDPATAHVRFHNPGLVQRILHGAADPTLAYLLVIGGALCLAFELFQPGFGVAGVAGIPLFALGLYGLTVLPTRWLALVATLAGVALLAADLALARLGWLTAAGTAALAAGSWLLLGEPFALPWGLVALVSLGTAGFFVFVMTTVLRAQGHQALAGAEQVIGKTGIVRSMLNPEGHVFIDGALWRARAPEDAGKVRTGTAVRVTGLNDRLTLDVELVGEDERSAV
jgi:membrane-bound serine protease (ClpP class)